MSNTLNPKDLTAEERALWDAIMVREQTYTGPDDQCPYSEVDVLAGKCILARRKLYGEPQGSGTIEMVEAEERFLGLRPCGIEVIQPAPPPAPVASELPPLPAASARLPKVRELIFYVRQLTPHLTNLGYADLSRSFEDHAAAASAELDAAQAVPVEAIRAFLNGITSREQRDAVRRYLAAVDAAERGQKEG